MVVRVGPDLHDDAKHKLDEIAARARLRGPPGGAGRTPRIAPGDCRIEWADGGVTRDRAATETTINVCVTRYLGARRLSHRS